MKKNIITILICVFCALLVGCSTASILDAEKLMESKQYDEALEVISRIMTEQPNTEAATTAKEMKETIQEILRQEHEEAQLAAQLEADRIAKEERQAVIDTYVEAIENGEFVTKDLTAKYKDDVEIQALTNYEASLLWLDSRDEKAKEYLRQISPSYEGVYQKQINELAMQLFKNRATWEAQHKIATEINARQMVWSTDRNRTIEVEIKKYVQSRYDHYDNIAGGYSGDKYTNTIFQETATKFGITKEEVEMVWVDPTLLALINKSTSPANAVHISNNEKVDL